MTFYLAKPMNNYTTLIIQYNTNLTLYLTILYDGHVFPLNCSKNIQIDNILQKFFQRTIMWFLIEAILSDVSNIIMKLTFLIPEAEHLRMLQIRIFMCVKCNRLNMHPCTKYPTIKHQIRKHLPFKMIIQISNVYKRT